MQNKDYVIRVNHISKSFNVLDQEVFVLKDINFELSKGEFAVIFGPSGSGKSTLLHTILGLEAPTFGEIIFLDKNLYSFDSEDKISEFRKMNMGVVYQQANWIQSLTVLDNVTFPLLLLGIDRKDALKRGMEFLKDVHMEEWANYKPTELSSGQQQKIALVRAIITDPDVIIADEPTGNLDFKAGEELMELLVTLSKKGKTIIMVTHDLEYAKYAGVSIHMFDGNIIGMSRGGDQVGAIKGIKSKKGAVDIESDSNDKSLKPEEIFNFQSLDKSYSVQKEEYDSVVIKPIMGFFTLVLKIMVVPINLIIGFINIILKIKKSKVRVGYINVDIKKFIYINSQMILSLFLLFFYIIGVGIKKILSLKFFPRSISSPIYNLLSNIYKKVADVFDRNKNGEISKLSLISLSMSNLRAKKTRTYITIGGMMVGIGAIVFLVSIGYGLQKLVISRVAKLNQLKQANVTTQIGGKEQINDKAIYAFKAIPHVTNVLPIISVVGGVDYKGSISNMAVYGVTSRYFKASNTHLLDGKFFLSTQTVRNVNPIVITTKPSAPLSTNIQNIPQIKGQSSLPLVNIPSLAAPIQGQTTYKVIIPKSLPKNIVVNQAMLRVLGINNAKAAIGKKIQSYFIATPNLLANSNQKLESVPTFYTIVGIISGNTTPQIYTPFINLRSMGITNYSEAIVIVSTPQSLAKVRKQIESAGFTTSSVADTVSQINGVFGTAQIILALFGFIALMVAALGMFNTLTISLLERTREVGLMKAMGIQSVDIKNLFLLESMIIAVFGGILGIVVGFIAGKCLGLILSVIAINKGLGYVDVSYIPIIFILVIVIISVVIGLVTGIYPARRATKISALNALRYE
ncbi:MAG: ABC transporter ATP-binding protein/permease [Patescibacteria group bacterium]